MEDYSYSRDDPSSYFKNDFKHYFEKLISQNETIISQNEKLLNIFLKYDQSYNEEIIKDQGRTDLM